MAGRSKSTCRLPLQVYLPILVVQVSFTGVYSLQVPSQGIVTTRLPSLTLQASPAKETIDNVYNGYNLDTSSLQDSLKAIRDSMDSIQESIDATKQTLESASISTASTTLSDASLSPSQSILEASTTTSSLPLNPAGMVQMDDATQIWNDVMAQLQNSPYFFPPSNDQYFPSSSVESMRDSVNSMQQSIQEVHAIHYAGSTTMLLANMPADNVAAAADAAASSTTSMAGTDHVPTLWDYLTGDNNIGAGDFQSQLSSSIVSTDNHAWKDATKFLENASSDSLTMLSNAKIKLSMMVYNTYLTLGLQAPEEYAKSGATVAPSVSLFTAFFATLWAIGSKQMARSQAEETMKTLILSYKQQQATLKSQMLPMKIEVSRLNGKVAELKEELHATNIQIERLEFKRTLERQFWATKLKAKRRRVHRMRQTLVTKTAQLEKGTLEHEERLDTIRLHNEVVEALSKNGKIVFDQSLKVVSFLGDKLAEQHQLHQTRMEDERLQKALLEVEEMNLQQQQLHQARMEEERLKEALREVEGMNLDVKTAITNSTASSPAKFPLYFATSQLMQP